MKKIFLFLSIILQIVACSNNTSKSTEKSKNQEFIQKTTEKLSNSVTFDAINEEKTTIKTRFNTPSGFDRIKNNENSYANYLQSLPLKPHGAKVHYYNGEIKNNNVYEAVINLDVGTQDLQQCADAAMRLRAEYLYHSQQYNKIHFNFTNGFTCDYNNWKAGKRIKLSGNTTTWVQKNGEDASYKTFRKYMDQVFMFAGTASLSKELKSVDIKDMQIGDIFIIGGFPGHAVTVVDMAENTETGEKLFMLAQSYMPAQEIQVLKNFENGNISPWYSLNFGEVLKTPEWTFTNKDLKRF